MEGKQLKDIDKNQLLTVLEERFKANMHRHLGVNWEQVTARIQNDKVKLWTIYQMEFTAGEPDVLLLDNSDLIYCDCSTESPKGRRSLCYDKKAWLGRKENKPIGNVMEMAQAMGVELLTQELYYQIQEFEDFDLKTSSWLLTPQAIRDKNGAIFGDKRYDHVFIYHNGAESYYAARGFRGMIRL